EKCHRAVPEPLSGRCLSETVCNGALFARIRPREIPAMPSENPTHDDHCPSTDGHANTAAEIVSHIADGLRSNLDPATLSLEQLRRRLSSDQASLEMLDQVDAALLAVDAMLQLNCTPSRHPELERVVLSKLLDEVFATLS